MARVTSYARGIGATLVMVIALTCVACTPGSAAPPEESSVSGGGAESEGNNDSEGNNVSEDVVAEAVREADGRVTDVTVQKSTSGLSTGWEVDVVLDDSSPVPVDELTALLLAIRRAGDADPGHIYLLATDPAGSPVDLTAAADELGIAWSEFSTGIGVVRTALDGVFGAENG